VPRVKEYGYVHINWEIPHPLRWAFRKVGTQYQVRGAGKVHDLIIEPRWGWDLIHRMILGTVSVHVGRGGFEGVEESLKERFRQLVLSYVRERIGYREYLNYEGRGKLLPHRYDPLHPTELPASGEEIGVARESLWLWYLLRRLGYDVPRYEKPPPGAIRMKFLEEPREEVWKLAYLLELGMFGSGESSGFLLNTSYLFEEYVGKLFGGKRVKLSVDLKPDFLLPSGVPLDAKYKEKPTRCDIYQAFTYAVYAKTRKAILVFPKTERKTLRMGDVTVEILSLL